VLVIPGLVLLFSHVHHTYDQIGVLLEIGKKPKPPPKLWEYLLFNQRGAILDRPSGGARPTSCCAGSATGSSSSRHVTPLRLPPPPVSSTVQRWRGGRTAVAMAMAATAARNVHWPRVEVSCQL
jgi:hypothetical protein